MQKPDPKITVLMPAYNAGKYIAEAVESVLGQSFTDFELLIVNDGSTDDTLAVIEGFEDSRIRVISQPNKGIAAALNVGLANARAGYIARFDADDVCYPDRLKTQYEFMTAYPEYSIMGTAVDYMDVEGQHIFTHQPLGHLNAEIQRLQYTVCPFIHSSVVYKKDVILKYGGYNEHAYTFEDHFLWVNILKSEKACNMAQPLIKVRLNPESITIDEKWRTRRFRDIKYSSLKKRRITAAEGDELHSIGAQQYLPKIKEGSYYALCAKKFLLQNHQPAKARDYVTKAIEAHPLRFDNYLLYLVSFFPGKVLSALHDLTPNHL